MHHIHGIPGRPIQAPPTPPPPPPEGRGKPFSLFSELDPILEGEGKLDPDGKGNAGGNGSPQDPNPEKQASVEETELNALPPPAPSIDAGIYTRNGKRPPPPAVGGNCSASV